MHEAIEATLIIKSISDQRNIRGHIAATDAEIGDYLPDLETVIQTARYFRDAGFKVLPKRHYLKISGSIFQFENIFGASIHGSERIDSVNNSRIPEMLNGILVRMIFQNHLAQAS